MKIIREIKRFLNNFIVSFEIFSSIQNFNAKELLIIQALQLRWNNFYNHLINSGMPFSDELDKYIQLKDDARLKILESNELETNKDYNMKLREIFSKFKTDKELWYFLSNYRCIK